MGWPTGPPAGDHDGPGAAGCWPDGDHDGPGAPGCWPDGDHDGPGAPGCWPDGDHDGSGAVAGWGGCDHDGDGSTRSSVGPPGCAQPPGAGPAFAATRVPQLGHAADPSAT